MRSKVISFQGMCVRSGDQLTEEVGGLLMQFIIRFQGLNFDWYSSFWCWVLFHINFLKLKMFKSVLGLLVLLFVIILNSYDSQQQLRKLHISAQQSLTHHCIHDEINDYDQLEMPQMIDEEITGEWRQMKILLDFSNVNASDPSSEFIEKRLINESMTYLSNIYQVQATPIIDEVIGRHRCGELHIPEEHTLHGVKDYDIVVYVGTKYSAHKGWLAASQACYFSRRNRRLVVGNIVVNTWYLDKTNPNSMKTDQLLFWRGVLVHEMTHLLGFMGSTWKMIREHTGNRLVTLRDGRYYITHKDVVEVAKKYWQCDDVYGLPLENNGGSGSVESHWEKSSFNPEIMTGSSVTNFYYSQFTALVLQATGWYKVNFDYVMDFQWGKGEGCQFAQSTCQPQRDIVEFCDAKTPTTKQLCSHDYMGAAYCFKGDQFDRLCHTWDERTGYDCRITDGSIEFTKHVQSWAGVQGGTSRCFQVTPNEVSCYASECLQNRIKFSIEGVDYLCSDDNSTVKVKIHGKVFEVKCPLRERFCPKELDCPQQCSGRGNCVRSQCRCEAGFGGEDCSKIQ